MLGSRVVRIQRHQATPSRNKNIIPGGEERGQAKSLSAASPGEDLKGINQQRNAKHTTETILEETAEPQQIQPAEPLLRVGKKGLSCALATVRWNTRQAPSCRAPQGSCRLAGGRGCGNPVGSPEHAMQ